MRIDVNLATRPFVNRTPQLSVLAALALLVVGCTAWNARLVLRSHAATEAAAAQRAEVAQDVAALEVRRASAEVRLAKADLRPLTLATDAANSVLAQKAVSWTLLLERLEELLPWSAALQDVQTHVNQEGTVKITLKFRAKTHDDALEFIDTLEQSPCFADVYPSADMDPKAPSTDYQMTIEASHDPFCGSPPPGLSRKHRLAVGKKVSRG